MAMSSLISSLSPGLPTAYLPTTISRHPICEAATRVLSAKSFPSSRELSNCAVPCPRYLYGFAEKISACLLSSGHEIPPVSNRAHLRHTTDHRLFVAADCASPHLVGVDVVDGLPRPSSASPLAKSADRHSRNATFVRVGSDPRVGPRDGGLVRRH